MVSVDQQHFRSCEVHTISGTSKDVKIIMASLIEDRNGIVIQRHISDKKGYVIVEIPK